MKTLLLFSAIAFSCALQAQQAETQYILFPKDSLAPAMANELKSFSSEHLGMFIQDDTSTLRNVVFVQDTNKVYVVLKWDASQEPSSMPAGYHADSASIDHKIFTASEIKEYINENEHSTFSMPGE